VLLDHALRDRADTQSDQVAHEHRDQSHGQRALAGVSRGQSRDDRNGEARQPEAGCDHLAGV